MCSTSPAQRRAYTTTDYNHILRHYSTGLRTAPQVAAHLGRPVQSIKSFIRDNPELKKRRP